MRQGHPAGLYFLFTVEMWERFSYYGMRALLMLYMIKYLAMDSSDSGTIYGMYTGLVYLTPLIGGYIADRYLGTRKCIFIGALLMALGHFTMALPSLTFFYAALGLLIIGNGFFKPNISTLVGQLYKKDDPRKDSGFTIFYMGINLGAFFSPIVCGTLGEKIGFHWGFPAAGFGMLIGLLTYLWGAKRFLQNHGLAPLHCKSNKNCDHERVNLDAPLTLEDKKRIAALFILVFFTIFFWASFEQAGSSLTLFADQSTNRMIPFFNWEFPVSYFQSVNPLLILILAPMFSSLWLSLSEVNKDPSTPVKFMLGLIFVSLGFVLMVIASLAAESTGKVSFLWLIGVYVLHTIGELCLSPVGISVVTKLAPAKFASILMGVWFLSSFFANFIGGLFAGNYDTMNHALLFAYPVFITLGSAIILAFLIKPLKKWMSGVD